MVLFGAIWENLGFPFLALLITLKCLQWITHYHWNIRGRKEASSLYCSLTHTHASTHARPTPKQTRTDQPVPAIEVQARGCCCSTDAAVRDLSRSKRGGTLRQLSRLVIWWTEDFPLSLRSRGSGSCSPSLPSARNTLGVALWSFFFFPFFFLRRRLPSFCLLGFGTEHHKGLLWL